MNQPTETIPTKPEAFPPLRDRPPMGLGKTMIGEEEEALVVQAIRNKQLFRYGYDLPAAEQGAMSSTLERSFCEKMKVDYALGVTSGSAALDVALSALGVGPGDEVIVAAWSWISDYTAVARLGARPVLAEIDKSFCLDPSEIARLTNARTKAIIVVHYQGVVADMGAILAEAEKVGVPVLEDCAQSPGAMYKGRRSGSMGAVGIYSFHFQKLITAGEGGMVVTNDPVLYERAVRAHDLGSYRPYHETVKKPELASFVGAQYRMNEMVAACALAQFRKLDGLLEHCGQLAAHIMGRIGQLPGLEFRWIPDPDGNPGYEIYFCLPNPELAVEASSLLWAHNINCIQMTRTRPHYEMECCIHRKSHNDNLSPFKDEPEWPAEGYRKEDFPRTENLLRRFVVIPMGWRYTMEDAEYIAETVYQLHGHLRQHSEIFRRACES